MVISLVNNLTHGYVSLKTLKNKEHKTRFYCIGTFELLCSENPGLNNSNPHFQNGMNLLGEKIQWFEKSLKQKVKKIILTELISDNNESSLLFLTLMGDDDMVFQTIIEGEAKKIILEYFKQIYLHYKHLLK